MAHKRSTGDVGVALLFAITLGWPDGELALPISEPGAGTEIRLLGLERALPWRWEDGTLYVDFGGIAVREIPGDWAWTVRLEGYLGAQEEERGVVPDPLLRTGIWHQSALSEEGLARFDDLLEGGQCGIPVPDAIGAERSPVVPPEDLQLRQLLIGNDADLVQRHRSIGLAQEKRHVL